MIMKDNGQENRFGPEDRTGKGSFQKHTERMRVFYETHPGALEVGASSVNTPANQEYVRTCRVALTVSETGGAATPIGDADWISLVPMWRMALRRFSPN